MRYKVPGPLTPPSSSWKIRHGDPFFSMEDLFVMHDGGKHTPWYFNRVACASWPAQSRMQRLSLFPSLFRDIDVSLHSPDQRIAPFSNFYEYLTWPTTSLFLLYFRPLTFHVINRRPRISTIYAFYSFAKSFLA